MRSPALVLTHPRHTRPRLIIDRLARRYTGAPFPMRSGIVFRVAPQKVGFMELPVEHAPAE